MTDLRRARPLPRIARRLQDQSDRARFWRSIRAEHPRFRVAVAADARITAARRGERSEFRSRLDLALQVARLCLVTESFFGQCCYRAKARCQGRGIPVLPLLLNHLAVGHGGIAVGDPVVMAAGVFIPHGQICVDGITRIGARSVIGPFTTIGLKASEFIGPTLGERTSIGTGARILGPCSIGDGAVVGANAVVTTDIPAGRTAVGIPARLV